MINKNKPLITINKLDSEKKKTFSNRTWIAVIVLVFYTIVAAFSYLVALPDSSWVNVLNRVDNPSDFNWSPLFNYRDIAGGLAVVLCFIVYAPLLMCLIDINNLIFNKNYKSLIVLIIIGSIDYFFPSIIYILFQYFSSYISLAGVGNGITFEVLFQKTFYVFALSIVFSSIFTIISANILLSVYKRNNFKNTITLNFLIFIVPIGFLSFSYIGIINGWAVVLMILFSIAGTDVFSYLSGMLFGKHKMAPVISPNKTWEGAIGGVLLTVLLIVIYALSLSSSEKTNNNIFMFIGFYTSSEPVKWVTLLLVSIGLAIFSILGDLLFSYIKRSFSIKDFGKTLKSHGGFLDRFDSLVISSFAFFVYSFAALAISLFANTNWGVSPEDMILIH
ncbi:MAG: phosphatidate cytidylyltransferase [Malacoplasma sp.]|nr:phosphatidate cytidylyltransferase [Malacoplasma sp.]